MGTFITALMCIAIFILAAVLIASVYLGKIPCYNPVWELPVINIDDIKSYLINQKKIDF